MANVEYRIRPENSALSTATSLLTPLGPAFMTIKNRAEEQRRCREMLELGLPPFEGIDQILADTNELCGIYSRLHPEHAYPWQRASELVVAHARGPSVALRLIEQWGFVRDQRGRLGLPDWWEGKVLLPLEFMDYSPEKYSDESVQQAGSTPERFHKIAQRASDHAWIGYYRVKGRLHNNGSSLLIQETANAALALRKRVKAPKDGPIVIYVIGISEDEVAALTSPDVCVVAFNRTYSPVMEKFIRNGRVKLLRPEKTGAGSTPRLVHAATGEAFRPEAGQCFLCQTDVADDRLPLPDGAGIVMTNFTLHHNSLDDQETMIREIDRCAMPAEGGGKAWVIGELYGNPDFVRLLFGPSSFAGPTAWDAWASFINAAVSVDHIRGKQAEWAEGGLKMRVAEAPEGLVKAPSFVHKLLMPPTQVLITGG